MMKFIIKHKKLLIIISSFLLVFFLVLVCCLLFVPRFRISGFNANRKIEYLEEYKNDPGNICYGSVFDCKDVTVVSEGEVDTSVLGDYAISYHISYLDNNLELSQTVSVVDEKSPEIIFDSDHISVCPNGKEPDFSYKIVDNYDGDLTEKASLLKNPESYVVEISDSNGNFAKFVFPLVVEDTIPPTITLKEQEEMTIARGVIYKEPGVSATDNCDEDVSISIEGEVNTNEVGKYEITYTVTDSSGNASSVKRIVNVIESKGTIYLTFDDGPGPYTAQLLDILKKYNIRATFFVTGRGDDDLILREYNEGHAVGLHTYSHDYTYIYQSTSAFFDDLYKVQERVKNITGETSFLMRFPGGSSNTVSTRYDGKTHIMSRLTREVEEKGFKYFDWNISSGDADRATSSDSVYSRVVNALGDGGSYVVLQHDIKGFSVDAVERIIEYGLNNAYIFDKLSMDSYGAHHRVNN